MFMDSSRILGGRIVLDDTFLEHARTFKWDIDPPEDLEHEVWAPRGDRADSDIYPAVSEIQKIFLKAGVAVTPSNNPRPGLHGEGSYHVGNPIGDCEPLNHSDFWHYVSDHVRGGFVVLDMRLAFPFSTTVSGVDIVVPLPSISLIELTGDGLETLQLKDASIIWDGNGPWADWC